MQALRKLALRLPDTDEGVACEGTALERRTVKARNKAFLFLGVSDAMLKLGESLPEATQLARKNPTSYRVGANGWVKATFGEAGASLELLAKWIEESHRMVSTGGAAKKAPRRAAEKRRKKSKASSA